MVLETEGPGPIGCYSRQCLFWGQPEQGAGHVEHEKDGNLRGVMDRFVALDKTLKSNIHLKNIEPLFFLVAKDKNQAESYKRKISEHGEWNKFKSNSDFYICSLERIETNHPKYVQTLTQHLIKIHAIKL